MNEPVAALVKISRQRKMCHPWGGAVGKMADYIFRRDFPYFIGYRHPVYRYAADGVIFSSVRWSPEDTRVFTLITVDGPPEGRVGRNRQ